MARVNLRACSLAAGLAPFGCDWCGKPLNRRKQRWCAWTCERAFYVNHVWGEARAEAIRLADRRCVRCGKRSDLEVNHITPLALTRPGAKNPYGASCQHHQDLIEVLCRPCHLDATAEQRARGAFSKGKRR